MASTKSTASTTISSGDFVKIDGKGIALVKQQVCRDGSSSRFKIVTDQEVNDFNIKQTNKNTLTKTISDLRIFQAFCNEPEIVIVPVSRKCTVL